MSHRTSRINALRGRIREFGLAVSVGARLGWSRSRACWPNQVTNPGDDRPSMLAGGGRLFESAWPVSSRSCPRWRQSAACVQLMSIPGVGLLTATAMVAATSGR